MLDRRALALAQMRVVLLDLSAYVKTRDWRALVLPRAHKLDGVELVVNHFFCGERAARRAIAAARRAIARLDELASLHAFLEFRFNLRNRGVTH